MALLNGFLSRVIGSCSGQCISGERVDKKAQCTAFKR